MRRELADFAHMKVLLPPPLILNGIIRLSLFRLELSSSHSPHHTCTSLLGHPETTQTHTHHTDQRTATTWKPAHPASIRKLNKFSCMFSLRLLCCVMSLVRAIEVKWSWIHPESWVKSTRPGFHVRESSFVLTKVFFNLPFPPSPENVVKSIYAKRKKCWADGKCSRKCSNRKKGCELAWRLSESRFDRKVRVLKLETAQLAWCCIAIFFSRRPRSLWTGEKGAAAQLQVRLN